MTIQVNDELHVDARNIGELSQLALIASDASYQGRFASGQLVPFDDTPQYASGPGGLQPQPPFGLAFGIATGRYVVHRTFNDPGDRTGFKAVAYRDFATNDVIIAFAGTDGSDLKDWWGNGFHYGWNQWDASRASIRA